MPISSGYIGKYFVGSLKVAIDTAGTIGNQWVVMKDKEVLWRGGSKQEAYNAAVDLNSLPAFKEEKKWIDTHRARRGIT